MQEVLSMLQQTKAELRSLPSPPSNDPILELMHRVNEFSDDILKQTEGFNQGIFRNPEEPTRTRSNPFEGIRLAHETFQSRIRATAPRFQPVNPVLKGDSPREVMVTGSPPQKQPSFFMFNEGAVSLSTQAPILLDEVVQKILKYIV